MGRFAVLLVLVFRADQLFIFEMSDLNRLY